MSLILVTYRDKYIGNFEAAHLQVRQRVHISRLDQMPPFKHMACI